LIIQECIDVIMNNTDRHRKEYFAGLLKEHFGGKMSKTYTTEVYEFGPDNDLIIKLPDELLEELKWFDGDKITWIDNNDGSFSLRKTDDNILS